MAQTTMVNFRIDEEVKKEMEEVCSKMGLTMTAALNLFINKVTMERRIPFEITADPDPFYSESNIRYLEKKIADYKAGKERAIGFLVGQAMKQTKGKANPQMLNKMFIDELNK